MKFDFKKLAFVLFMWLIFATLILWITSCSAQWHLQKAIKKGANQEVDTAYQYVYDTDTIYNEVTKTFEVVRTKTDSIPYAVTTYVTSPLTRRELKAYKDSLKHERQIYKDSLRSAIKSKKIEYRTKVKVERSRSKWWVWFLLGGFVFIGMYLIFRFVVNYLISRMP